VGTGLRIGEALALKTDNLSPDCRVIHVRHTIWAGQEQPPKTSNAVLAVDVPELLAGHLREHVANKCGYLFPTASGKPIGQRNVLRALHATGKKIGLHSLRRFRAETLRRSRVPEDLTKLWLGRSEESVTDFYAGGLQNDLAWRQEWCERARLGFSLDGLRGLQNAVPLVRAKAA
jgi:integrase